MAEARPQCALDLALCHGPRRSCGGGGCGICNRHDGGCIELGKYHEDNAQEHPHCRCPRVLFTAGDWATCMVQQRMLFWDDARVYGRCLMEKSWNPFFFDSMAQFWKITHDTRARAAYESAMFCNLDFRRPVSPVDRIGVDSSPSHMRPSAGLDLIRETLSWFPRPKKYLHHG